MSIPLPHNETHVSRYIPLSNELTASEIRSFVVANGLRQRLELKELGLLSNALEIDAFVENQLAVPQEVEQHTKVPRILNTAESVSGRRGIDSR